MQRRSFIAALAAYGVAALATQSAMAATSKPLVEVWKDPSCGCCKDWISHMQANGFSMKVYETGGSAARARLGMPQTLGSCHTALVEGYVVEGHVPAREVKRLLREQRKALGLAAPGMPLGAPGMDGPVYGGRKTPYDVLLVQADGRSAVYQSYR